MSKDGWCRLEDLALRVDKPLDGVCREADSSWNHNMESIQCTGMEVE